jgi:Skp family chaperone for outer membrane proteins
MKKQIVLSAFILLALISCDKSKTQEKEKPESPKVLTEESSLKMVSRQGYDDLVMSLYKELADKTPELKELEQNIENLETSKSDSTEAFLKYDRKNNAYYNSANRHVDEIRDSVLRKKMKSFIASSIAQYKTNIARHTRMLASIDTKTLTLNDLHEILIITTTLPLIEAYQHTNLPTTKPMGGYLKQIDKTVNYENTLVQGYENKEKN